MKVSVEKSEGSRGIREFAEAAFAIREDRFLPGLSTIEWTVDLLGFDFSFPRSHWIVRDGPKIVGRVGANVSPRDPSRGYIGFYECALGHAERDAIHRALLDTAESWLRANGVKTAYGPIDYQTWFPYRFRTLAPAGTPDFAWEPLQPETYPELWRATGFEVAERYSSKCSSDLRGGAENTRPYYERCSAAGFRFRAFRDEIGFASELPLIQEINQRSFQAGFLTEAIDPRAYAKLYVPQFAGFGARYCYFALDPGGKEIGYFFVFADQDHFIWKTVAVASEFQRLGVGAFGMHHGIQLALRDGFRHSIAALVKEGAPSEGLTSKPRDYDWAHEYAVFRKIL